MHPARMAAARASRAAGERGGASFDSASFDSASFDRASFDRASFGSAPFENGPFGSAASSRTRLFDLSVGLVEDVRAQAPRGSTDAEAFSPDFQLALPYRGFFVWHVGQDEVVGDANQVLFVTGGEAYRMSHPLPGGYAEIIITPNEQVVEELGADAHPNPLFRRRSRRLSPRLQGYRAQLLAWARARADGSAEADPLAAEELVLALLRTPVDEHRPVERPAPSTQRLMRRTKAFLEAELAKPLRLTNIGRAVGASPLYLTHMFRAIEGVPLHQYLNQLRLARALAELPHATDLTRLALEVGFSSHSHFTARFRRAFGTTPSAFRRSSRFPHDRGAESQTNRARHAAHAGCDGVSDFS